MSKVKIIDKKSEKNILEERDLLSKLKHPFIVNMICAFQDYEKLYILMDLLTGGDLRYHFNTNHVFAENEIRFFISCLILSLEYIHNNNIIHRDIKPENLICDDKGYVRLTDFGVAKIKKDQNSSETSGTPGYMAPEVLLGQNHSFTVDFYAIGIIGYEFLMGERPYIGKNRKEIKNLVLNKEVSIDNKDKSWTNDCMDFINRCLKRDATKRLGYNNGIKELKNHPWFTKYDWLNLYNKKLVAPYVPKKGKNFDKKYCESNEKISNSTFERYKGYMRKNDYVKIFEGYTYFNNDLTTNTVENETVTRVSTSTKGNNNRQEFYENQSYGNIVSSNNNDKLYNVTHLRNMVDSSINKGNISVDYHKIVDKKIDDSKDIEDYKHNIKKGRNTVRHVMKMDSQRIMNKKQISVDILNINRELKKVINNKRAENMYNNQEANNSKGDSFEIKEEINNNGYNLKDINNSISDMNNKFINIVNNNSKNNVNELNLYKKIIIRNISNSNSIEKQLKSNNEQNKKNINNISVINFKNYKKKQLNIHSLMTKESNINEGKGKGNGNDKKIIPILLPPLNKIYNNNCCRNNSQNSQFLLSNIRHFKFKIVKKKKIKYFNFNQNKIIENYNASQDSCYKPPVQNIPKISNSNNLMINENTNYNNHNINVNNINTNNLNNNNINNINISNEQKPEIYKKIVNNDKLINWRTQLGKSQSTGLFPKIKIS
jgi:serine/threonine protein kinase